MISKWLDLGGDKCSRTEFFPARAAREMCVCGDDDDNDDANDGCCVCVVMMMMTMMPMMVFFGSLRASCVCAW